MNNHEFLRLQTGLAVQDFKSLETILAEFDRFLTLRTFTSSLSLSQKDSSLWTILCLNKVALGLIRRATFANITRWYTYLETTYPELQEQAKLQKSATQGTGPSSSQAQPRYGIQLQDADKGVVTRFPPEPSGYLHIGHAKAAFLNDYFAHDAYKGSLILRFDDTNPRKEKQEYEESIETDLASMGIRFERVTYTSDYFEQLYQLCEKLISQGKAYAEDTDPKVQAQDRKERKPSARRDRPAAESLAIFKEMRDGTDLGKKHCIRARIAFGSSNGALRDPVIYRFPNWENDQAPQPHHRTGWAWKIYPTYDFACPLVDSIEGVTHALRTTEYADRNDQYDWFLKALDMRHVHLWDFARLNFIRTFLSKRKLSKVVDTGMVDGWDDPRMPTVRGIIRRGLRVDILREFMLKQGPSRNVVNMDWTVLWAMNKKAIDPIAPRHTAVESENVVIGTIHGGPDVLYEETRPKHPKNLSIGTKNVTFASKIYLDQVDAISFTEGEEITLMTWGNAIVKHITKSDAGIVTALDLDLHLEGDVGKTDKKVHWLAVQDNKTTSAQLWEFDYLLTKDNLEKTDDLDQFLNPVTATTTRAIMDTGVASLVAGDVIQLERKGYYRVDKTANDNADKILTLFKIPTGSKK